MAINATEKNGIASHTKQAAGNLDVNDDDDDDDGGLFVTFSAEGANPVGATGYAKLDAVFLFSRQIHLTQATYFPRPYAPLLSR